MKQLFTRAGKTALVFLLPTAALAQYLPEIRINKEYNTPTSINFTGTIKPAAAEASGLLRTYLNMGSSDELRLQNTTKKGGLSIARYHQYHSGIRVTHGSFVATSKEGQLSYLSGRYITAPSSLQTIATITEQAALQIALKNIGATTYAWQDPAMEKLLKRATKKADTTYYPKGTLQYIENWSSGSPDRILHLAYRFVIFAQKPMSNDELFIDATNGQLLFKNTLLQPILGTGNSMYSGNVQMQVDFDGATQKFLLNDVTRGGGIFTGTMQHTTNTSMLDDIYSSTANFNTNAGVDVHWAAQKTYDYWFTQQSRDSYDGAGGSISMIVNYDTSFNNAFWGGFGAFFGDGSGVGNGGFDPLVSLDVCAHEIGHGVCASTADLIYQKESGALNEGFSDIWGAVIENWADPHETDIKAKSRWVIGEEISAIGLRSMQDPKLRLDPDTYLGIHWVNTVSCTPTSTNDQCGVHTNSGVLNHWFYLLTEGGAGTNDIGNSFSIQGIGIDTAADLAYLTELSLFATAGYLDARDASISAARANYGMCSNVEKMVTKAWYAVGVGPDFVPCAPQTVSGIENSSSFQINNPFNDDLYLNYNISKSTSASVRMLDMTGKTVFRTDVQLNAGKYCERIDLSSVSLPAGNYALQVVTAEEVFTAKMVHD